jgi:hypothetical protein
MLCGVMGVVGNVHYLTMLWQMIVVAMLHSAQHVLTAR